MFRTLVFVAAFIVGLCGATLTHEIMVKQRNKQFSVEALRAKVGDTLVFLNDDPYVHNIFSLSDAQSFDLGTFGKGETRKVTLNKAGIVEIECAVHPEMKLNVEVVK